MKTSAPFGAEFNNVYGYNAESYNPNIDMQYLRARYYNLGTAAFVTEDSYLGDITNPLSLNRYNYVKSSPLNYIDPDGHKPNDYFNADEFWDAYFQEMYNSADRAWKELWGDIFGNVDKVVDIEMEAGFGIGTTFNVQGVKGEIGVIHKRVYDEKNFKEEKEVAKVSIIRPKTFVLEAGAEATSESGWNYEKFSFDMVIVDNVITGINVDKDYTAKMSDSTVEFGISAYSGIGGGAKIIINLSELARILGLLSDNKQCE